MDSQYESLSEPLGFLVGNHNTITFKINTGDEPEKEKLNK